MNFFEYTGLIGGLILSIQMWPQIYKVYKTHSVNDISKRMIVINLIGLNLMQVYAIGKKSPELYLPLSLEISYSLILFIFTIIYKNQHEINE